MGGNRDSPGPTVAWCTRGGTTTWWRTGRMAAGALSASGLYVSGLGDGGGRADSTAGLGGYEGTRTDVGRRYGLGTIRWVGESAALGPGVWAGVELDQKLGKHDGTVFGMRYFVCLPGHGLMTRVEKLAPAKNFEEGDKKVIAAARSHNAALRQRSASRQDRRPASRQDALAGNFAERAFNAARDNRATLGLAMGDAAKGAAQSAVRAAKLRARAMAEKERTSDHRVWQLRGAAEPLHAEERAAEMMTPETDGSFDDRTSVSSAESPGSRRSAAVASAGSERRVPVTSVPTDGELALLASALGAPKTLEPSATTWPWAADALGHEAAQDPKSTTSMPGVPENATRVDPAVENAAAAALDVDPQQLRAVFEAARAATGSAGSEAGARPVPTSHQCVSVSAPAQRRHHRRPRQQLQQRPHAHEQDEDDLDDSNLGRWEQDDELPSEGEIYTHNSPGMETTSKMRRSRESFGIVLTNSSHVLRR